MDKLEDVVNARVTDVMSGLNMASTDDTKKLAAELKKLSAQVTALEKKLNASSKAKAAPRKAAVKKALAPKTEGKMTVAEKKQAAEAIANMKPVSKDEASS